MSISVGTRIFNHGKSDDPFHENYTTIIPLTKCTEYFSLSPYSLRIPVNEQGEKIYPIFENYYQFSKRYPQAFCSEQYESRWVERIPQNVIWKWDISTHVGKNNKIEKDYWEWRMAGMTAEKPIRYPVGFTKRNTVHDSIIIKNWDEEEFSYLDYIEARKEIYFKKYYKYIKKEKQFKELLTRLSEGENLLLIDVDGPREESMPYYKEKYNVDDDFITNRIMKISGENLKILLNDTKHPFGHCFCLAFALQTELKK